MPQRGRYDSPWPLHVRVRLAIWSVVWLLVFRPTPKCLYRWRAFLLSLFGTQIRGDVFVAASARVKMPWHLVLEDRACIGSGVQIYNLGVVTLKARCTVAQEAYLCAGTHDLADWRLPLVLGDITVGEEAFIAARALILPGVQVGSRTVVGAGSVVTKDLPEGMICAGNPCRPLKPRTMKLTAL